MAGGTDEASLTSQIASLTCQIGKKLQGDVSADWLSCSIFKVPNHLRQISEQAYEPQVISIGPYHHGKDQLKAMEVHKMHYLKMLLDRRKETSLEGYVTALKNMEEEARKFYSQSLAKIDGEEFVEIMLLDGCFIIEIIRKSAMEELRLKNDHLLTHFILRRVMHDMLLVENQLPFFILSELFYMTVRPNDKAKDFMDMAINFFSRMMPGSQIGRPKNQDIKHLLGLLHDSYQAPSPHCQEVRLSCSILEKVKSLCPKAKLHRCSSEVVRSSPPEPLEEVRFALPKAIDMSHSSLSKLSEEGQIMQMKPQSVAVPSVSFSSVVEAVFPSDSDNLLFQATAAPSTSFLEPKSSEELRFLQPKAMTMPSSSLSKSSEEIVSTAAPFVDFSVPNSLKEAKFLPSDSSHPCYLEEMDAPAAEPSITFSPPKSSKEVRLPSAGSVSFSPQVMRQSEESVSFSSLNSKMNEQKNGKWQFIRSATELSEAGINFEKTLKGTLFDIKFEKGVMSIPTLSINDNTESILRNLAAYEQYFEGASSKCFTDYITFMDCLINTGKDVELLCLHGVIDNWLGDDEMVAAIFNKCRDSLLISEEDFSYAETFNEVNKHCNRTWNRWKAKWNRWMANLWQNYFNSPWAVISFLAAVFLLLLTVLQSVYSLLSYYQFK